MKYNFIVEEGLYIYTIIHVGPYWVPTLKSLFCTPILVNEKLKPDWNAVFTEKNPQEGK